MHKYFFNRYHGNAIHRGKVEDTEYTWRKPSMQAIEIISQKYHRDDN